VSNHADSDTAETAASGKALANRRKPQRVLAVIVILSVLGAGLIGFAVWQSGRTKYQVVSLRTMADKRILVRVAYPDTCTLDGREGTHAGPGSTMFDNFTLVPRRASGLQSWFDVHILRIPSSQANNTQLEVLLQQIPKSDDLDSDIARLRKTFRMLLGPNGHSYVRKTSCPAGPMIELEFVYPGNGSAKNKTMFGLITYPPAMPSRIRYEIIVRCASDEALRSRMRNLALDVVSRLRVVEEK